MSEEIAPPKESVAVSILGDPKDPRSLHSMLPEQFVNKAFTITDEHQAMTDFQILKPLKKETQVLVSRLREALWLQIYAHSNHGGQITMRSVYHGVCTHRSIEHHLNDPTKIAYILRPPADYQLCLQEMLTFSTEQIRDIMSQSHIDPETGALDPKIADVKRRIFENIADRVKGMPIQRTENLNVNKEIGVNQSFGEVMDTVNATEADLDKKLRELEKDLGDVKDVTPNE